MQQTILITGAAGYIGSRLTERLLKNGHKVIAIDNLQYNQGHVVHHIFNHPNCIFHQSDVVNDTLTYSLIPYADIVIPLSAIVGAPACQLNSAAATNTNLKAIQNTLYHMHHKQHIIYTNTNSGYGSTLADTICTEDTPLNSISLYGETKNKAEEIVRNHTRYTVFRLATVFGTSYRHRLDLLVNTLAYEAYFNEQIELFEGDFRRNFIHIDDVVDCIALLINEKHHLVMSTKEVFNLGNRCLNTTKTKLAQTISDYFNLNKPFKILSKQDPDKRDYVVSNEKAYKAGFYPKLGFGDGLYELRRLYSMLSKNAETRQRQTEHMKNI